MNREKLKAELAALVGEYRYRYWWYSFFGGGVERLYISTLNADWLDTTISINCRNKACFLSTDMVEIEHWRRVGRLRAIAGKNRGNPAYDKTLLSVLFEKAVELQQ